MKEALQARSIALKTSLFHTETKEGEINFLQVLTGLFILIAGVLFYYLCRSADQTYFLRFFGNNPNFRDFLSPGYTLIGNSLPTFIHVVAFTVMTAGIIARQKRGYINVCLFWFAVDCLFEVGQGFNKAIIQIIPDWFSGFLFLENARDYFLQGHFDYLDLLSIVLGSLAAYIILVKTSKERGGMKRELSAIIKFVGFAVIFALGIFSIIASGGGGGGGGTTDPETIFPLTAPGADVPGYNATGNLSGTVTVDGISYNASGTFGHQTRAIIFLNDFGVNAMPDDILLTIDIATPQGPLPLSILATTYLNADTGNNEPVFSEDNDGLTGVPIEIHLLPAVGQVGDFGEVTSWLYDNGWTETGTWSLESSTPGFANLVINGSIYDAQNILISTGKITTQINEMGEPVHLTYFQNDLTEGIVLNFIVTPN